MRSQSSTGRAGDRRARREAGGGDEDVEPAVGEHRRVDGAPDGRLVGDVGRDRDRAAETIRGHELVCHLLRAVGVQVGDDDVRSALGEHARGRAADAARAAGDERDLPAQLALRRRLGQLEALGGQYSIAKPRPR